MIIKFNYLNKYKLAVLLCSMSFFAFSQTNTQKQVQYIFDQLITVYGSAKATPKLELVKKGKYLIPPAKYLATPIPTIEVDVDLYKVCQTFGKDSLNALAIVLSHELTHYYNDHLFCSDYAYANLYSNNPVLAKTIKNASFSSRAEKESEADIKGFFFAAAAGFSPFGLQSQLIDKIYKAYNLPDIQKGYPTKQERIEIANSAEEKSMHLYGEFQIGLKAMEEKRYDDAIVAFETANSFIPFRENFNNIGVAKTLKALEIKDPSDIEKKFPNRFKYPLELDNASRLQREKTRGLDDDSDEMNKLLINAKKDFEVAIRLDPSYTIGYINLASVLDLLDNYPKAIGTILELPKEQQKTIDAKRILAIAYYHNKQLEEANIIWHDLKM